MSEEHLHIVEIAEQALPVLRRAAELQERDGEVGRAGATTTDFTRLRIGRVGLSSLRGLGRGGGRVLDSRGQVGSGKESGAERWVVGGGRCEEVRRGGWWEVRYGEVGGGREEVRRVARIFYGEIGGAS